MSSSSSNISGRKRKRGVTRRVTDDKGNIKVIKYQKKSKGLSIPGLTWGKVPSLLLGLPFAIYSGLIYSSGKGYLTEGLGRDILDSTSELSATMKLVLTGTLGMVLSGFLGYALIRKGFKIRKYPSVTREIVAMWATFIILSAILSPFINEPGLVRQQSDDEFVIDNRDFDVSGLNSPFYSEFLNGLLDLLGNIPDPKEEVAYIRPIDGQKLDSSQDRYLYRWRVAETYDTGLADFEQGFTGTQLDYINGEDNYNAKIIAGGTIEDARKFRIQEQYLTISSSYLGDALVPWNSEFGGAISNDFDNMDAEVSNNGTLIPGSINGYRDINEQPVLTMAFDTPRTQGFVNYDAYWIAEDKDKIADNSIAMDQMTSTLKVYPETRFGDLSSADSGEISGIWGLKSLPTNYIDRDNADANEFVAKYDSYKTILDNNKSLSVYNFALLIYNDIQNAVVNGLFDGSLNIDPTQTSGVADPGADKAYWFYKALEDPTIQFGMKELLAGFVNMLRAFDIPARPIIGFSVGNFQDALGNDCSGNNCDQIEILFEHLHVWIEVMIPVDDGSRTTFNWGMFNPVPDPWILQDDSTDFEFGRNSLGGSPNIEVEITSGNPTSLLTPISIDPFPTTSTFFTNKMGEDLTGRVRISYEGNPAEGQTVSLRLINESEMLTGSLDPDIGIELPSVVTNDANGWGNFRLYVDREGKVFTYDANDVRSNTSLLGITIQQVDALQNIGDIGLYGIVAIYSLNFNGSLTGWELDANLELVANVTSTTIINPNTGGNVVSYGALFGDTLQFTVTVTDNDTLPMEGISDIQFLLLSEDDYNNLIASLILQIPINTIITANRLGFFTTTDIFGNATIEVDFDDALIAGGKPANEIYVALALIQAGLKYNQDPVFVWFERNLSMESILYNSSTPIPDDGSVGLTIPSPSASWDVVTNITAFDNPGNQVFPVEPAEGVNLQYYIIKQSAYDPNSGTWLSLKNNVLDFCSTLFGADCYTLTVNTGQILNGITLTGDVVTQANGSATVTFDLINVAFAGDWYYIVITAEEFSSFIRTSLFFSQAPPGGLALNNLENINKNIQKELVEVSSANQPNTHILIIFPLSLVLVMLSLLLLSRRRLI